MPYVFVFSPSFQRILTFHQTKVKIRQNGKRTEAEYIRAFFFFKEKQRNPMARLFCFSET